METVGEQAGAVHGQDVPPERAPARAFEQLDRERSTAAAAEQPVADLRPARRDGQGCRLSDARRFQLAVAVSEEEPRTDPFVFHLHQ
jgi:hypothetical protein